MILSSFIRRELNQKITVSLPKNDRTVSQFTRWQTTTHSFQNSNDKTQRDAGLRALPRKKKAKGGRETKKAHFSLRRLCKLNRLKKKILHLSILNVKAMGVQPRGLESLYDVMKEAKVKLTGQFATAS